jgi:hypothetical protein
MTRRTALALATALLIAPLHAAEPPKGWHAAGSAPEAYEMSARPGDRRAGDRNAYIRALPQVHGFGTMMQSIGAETYRGKRLRLSGYLSTREANSAAMWMRIDAAGHQTVGFDNMDKRSLHGDTDWKRYDIVLDVPQNAELIAFGFLLEGKGEVLADDFKLEEVSKDVPVTGIGRPVYPSAPVNLDFSQP